MGKTSDKLIDGIIYKIKQKSSSSKPAAAPGGAEKKYEKIDELEDIEFELARVSGLAVDKPIIQNVPYSNWAGVHFADPIPTELAMPSDIRFREDLVMLKQGGQGKGKVAKGKLSKQQKKDKAKAK